MKNLLGNFPFLCRSLLEDGWKWLVVIYQECNTINDNLPHSKVLYLKVTSLGVMSPIRGHLKGFTQLAHLGGITDLIIFILCDERKFPRTAPPFGCLRTHGFSICAFYVWVYKNGWSLPNGYLPCGHTRIPSIWNKRIYCIDFLPKIPIKSPRPHTYPRGAIILCSWKAGPPPEGVRQTSWAYKWCKMGTWGPP